jgi:hypothetical protein
MVSFPGGFTVPVGHSLYVHLNPTSSASGYVGAVFQYTLPALSLVPISPVRVFDSRFARFGGPLIHGTSRTIDVKDAIDPITGLVTVTDAIPQGARAISFNLTVTGTVANGYLAALPGTSTTVTVSTINWSTSSQTLANGGMVTLGTGSAERLITLVVGGTKGSTHAILDITGYYE